MYTSLRSQAIWGGQLERWADSQQVCPRPTNKESARGKRVRSHNADGPDIPYEDTDGVLI